MERRTSSLADQVYERLENDILSGKYTRGEVLTELRLCSELDVSRTPIRESLRKLEQEHLIETTGNGIVILGITRKDFEDMYIIRSRIEDLAIRGFIKNLTEESLHALQEAVEFQEFYLEKSDSAQLRALDSRFHQIIYEHCGSTILRDTLYPLHKKVQKFRQISLEERSRAEKSVCEHRMILEAVRSGNEDEAAKLMLNHVSNAMRSIMEREFIN
ncbi:MAG: GntR family transcriptional regulator [Clostridia bacterium]|nr:GntR family transcriptional regulator [Clostridia bacterium]